MCGRYNHPAHKKSDFRVRVRHPYIKIAIFVNTLLRTVGRSTFENCFRPYGIIIIALVTRAHLSVLVWQNLAPIRVFPPWTSSSSMQRIYPAPMRPPLVDRIMSLNGYTDYYIHKLNILINRVNKYLKTSDQEVQWKIYFLKEEHIKNMQQVIMIITWWSNRNED